MRKGMDVRAKQVLSIALIGAVGLLALSCGGGPGPDPGNTKDMYVQRFSVPNFSGILLDEEVSWVFSHDVDPTTLNHDSIRLRTGTQGGNAPRGTFVQGIFLIDSGTNTRIVVDPDQISAAVIAEAERTGDYTKLPAAYRYDLGAFSAANGNRQVLFNHSYGNFVTFVPEVPSRPDLADTGYDPGATYTVVLPSWPALNVVQSVDGYPLLPRGTRIFTSTFTTVPLAASQLFLGGENEGNPRVINTEPNNGFRVNVVEGEPVFSGTALSMSRVSASANRPITASFRLDGFDNLENAVTDTISFSSEIGPRSSAVSFARVSKVTLESGSLPQAFRDAVNPANDLDPASVSFRRLSEGTLFLVAAARETADVVAPAEFPLGFGVQIENPNQPAPNHVAEINPSWATPVLQPQFDGGGNPILDGNGNQVMAVLGVDVRISIRFSQPLDPRTITTENFFLSISSVSGRPQVPVSLFLRQSRLGVVEVLMTPLTTTGLPTGQFYEVTVSSGVSDLLGSPLNAITTSFEISAGGAPPVIGDIVETFTNSSKEDASFTTANWDGTKPFVGAVPDDLTAVFAPFAGNGSGGALAPIAGSQETMLDTGSTTQTIYNYTSVSIGFGVVVRGSGSYGLVIRSQGDVSIAGLLSVAGAAGGEGGTGATGDTVLNGGLGGNGGPGGFPGGAGGKSPLQNSDGQNGSGPAGIGGGKGGLSGDQEAGSSSTDPLRLRVAGGGGGHATPGTRSDSANSKGQGSGEAGGAYGKPDFSDAVLVPAVVGVPTLTNGFGGAGGGGGGGEDDVDSSGIGGTVGGEDEGGGGGGGGGGALQIVTYTHISVSGRITANGGDGGKTNNPATGGLGQGAGGGGGAGGSIWLQTYGNVVLDQAASITALGGKGAQGDWNGITIQKGGNGGDGYIRFDAKGTVSTVPAGVTPATADTVGVFSPSLALNSVARSLFYNQFIPTPNYGAVVVDSSDNGGTITVWVQGAREDLVLSGPQPVDPDVDLLRLNTTDWVPISQIDMLDNYQYLRFRVDFTVDPLHSFATPLPIVRSITIPVSTQ